MMLSALATKLNLAATGLSVKLMPILASGGATTGSGATADGLAYNEGQAGQWSPTQALEHGANNATVWGGLIIVILGVILIVLGAYRCFKNLKDHGKGQTSWAVAVACLVLGGVMAFGGWALFGGTIAAGLADTARNWGTPSSAAGMIPLLQAFLG